MTTFSLSRPRNVLTKFWQVIKKINRDAIVGYMSITKFTVKCIIINGRYVGIHAGTNLKKGKNFVLFMLTQI